MKEKLFVTPKFLLTYVVGGFSNAEDATSWWEEEEKRYPSYREPQAEAFQENYRIFPAITLSRAWNKGDDESEQFGMYYLLDGWHRFALSLMHNAPFLEADFWPPRCKITPESIADCTAIYGFNETQFPTS